MIWFIFKSFNLIGDLTVYENVELPFKVSSDALVRAKGECDAGSRASGYGASNEALTLPAFGR